MSDYAVVMTRELRPGQWVYHTPRDKQVVLVEKPPGLNHPFRVLWGDLTTTKHTPFDNMLVARPYTAYPHLGLVSYGRTHRWQNFVDNVVIPTLDAFRSSNKYAKRDMGLLDSNLNLRTDPLRWDRIVRLMVQNEDVANILRINKRLAEKGNRPLTSVTITNPTAFQHLTNIDHVDVWQF